MAKKTQPPHPATLSSSYLLHDPAQLEETCVIAVRAFPTALQYVRNQTEYICYEAVKAHWEALKYVNDLSDELIVRIIQLPDLDMAKLQQWPKIWSAWQDREYLIPKQKSGKTSW